MSHPLAITLYRELDKLRLIDPHTHIEPHRPAAKNLSELLGYHYYTELAHSAGLPRHYFGSEKETDRERVAKLMEGAHHLDNTIQWSWMVELSRELFGFTGDHLGKDNWETLFDLVLQSTAQEDWPDRVLEKSGIDALYLTNDFDDPLTGFNSQRYIPCLRTDELVFHFCKPGVRQRLSQVAGIELSQIGQVAHALGNRFEHFVRHGAKACAISLPPYFSPRPISDAAASQSLEHLLQHGESSDTAHKQQFAYWVFWRLAEYCAEFRLPFDLMIGVNRQVYPGGVYQGQDLYDSRLSLIQYAELFNHFPQVRFPISVLASVTNQELTDYAWIFPNVIAHGHWWYSNTPSFIRRDLTARLEAVPRNKIIGYYSDAYKLEFMLPKFRMFKRILAEVLADEFVIGRCWTEAQAIEFGSQVLRGNVESTFG